MQITIQRDGHDRVTIEMDSDELEQIYLGLRNLADMLEAKPNHEGYEGLILANRQLAQELEQQYLQTFTTKGA